MKVDRATVTGPEFMGAIEYDLAGYTIGEDMENERQ